ncbi:hypothetical protein BD779DRAFT_1564279 [Infundibulicybe gibba]|nr:hypothetical protein BD779DRAFT_1564279 [Infundibulicybe gibba]
MKTPITCSTGRSKLGTSLPFRTTRTDVRASEVALLHPSPTPVVSPSPDFLHNGPCNVLYNVSYLAFTQNVDVLLNQAGDVLNNLWSVCWS